MFVTLPRAMAQEAVAAAFAAFALRHPAYVASLFDEHFLQTRLAPLLWASGSTALTPTWLAEAWAAQLGGRSGYPERLVAEAIPVAADFIDLLMGRFMPPRGSQPAIQPDRLAAAPDDQIAAGRPGASALRKAA